MWQDIKFNLETAAKFLAMNQIYHLWTVPLCLLVLMMSGASDRQSIGKKRLWGPVLQGEGACESGGSGK